jgi:hypothetical protein
MTTIYVFELNENKYYITEFKNDVIEPIKDMVKKLVSENDFDKINSLLTEKLGATLSSFEWIQKYPIKKIAEIKENSNLEKVSIYYIKEYGIDNVRSDMYKDIVLSPTVIKYIDDILLNSDAPVPIRIKLIDEEINKLKSTFDFITENNVVIGKYLKYKHDFYLSIKDCTLRNKANDIEFNVLIPNFIDIYLKSMKDLVDSDESTEIKYKLEKYFSNHKIVEEIANTLLLQKKNQKLIFKYGTLDEINKKLASMLYRKIDLINMLEMDDIQEEEEEEEEEEDEEDGNEEGESDDDEDDDDEDEEEEQNKCNDCGESTVQLVLIDDKPALKCLNCDG